MGQHLKGREGKIRLCFVALCSRFSRRLLFQKLLGCQNTLPLEQKVCASVVSWHDTGFVENK